MKFRSELSVQQIARRVLSKIPELDYTFVVSSIQDDTTLGLDEFSVQNWLYYFDSILIDEQQGRMTFEEKANCQRN